MRNGSICGLAKEIMECTCIDRTEKHMYVCVDENIMLCSKKEEKSNTIR